MNKNPVFYIVCCYIFAVIALSTTSMAVWLSFEKKDLKKQLVQQQENSLEMTRELSAMHDALKAQKPLKETKNSGLPICDESKGMCVARPKAKVEEQTLAVKNNNPLNVKALKHDRWQGQVATDEFNHAVFSAPEYGLRAGASVLMNYYATHKLDTLEGIVERFCEGNKKEYCKFLSDNLKLKPDQKFNVMEKMSDLLFYMARFESGREWPRSMFIPYTITHVAYKKGQQS